MAKLKNKFFGSLQKFELKKKIATVNFYKYIGKKFKLTSGVRRLK